MPADPGRSFHPGRPAPTRPGPGTAYVLGQDGRGWIAVLRDKTRSDVRCRQAMMALSCFGPEAKSAVPDLIDAVRKPPLRDEAVGALVQIGSGAEVNVLISIDRFLKRGRQHLTGQGTFLYDNSMEDLVGSASGRAGPLDILTGPNRNTACCCDVGGTAQRRGPPSHIPLAIQIPMPSKNPRNSLGSLYPGPGTDRIGCQGCNPGLGSRLV